MGNHNAYLKILSRIQGIRTPIQLGAFGLAIALGILLYVDTGSVNAAAFLGIGIVLPAILATSWLKLFLKHVSLAFAVFSLCALVVLSCVFSALYLLVRADTPEFVFKNPGCLPLKAALAAFEDHERVRIKYNPTESTNFGVASAEDLRLYVNSDDAIRVPELFKVFEQLEWRYHSCIRFDIDRRRRQVTVSVISPVQLDSNGCNVCAE